MIEIPKRNRWMPPLTLEALRDMVEMDTNGGCWLWPGALSKGGYARYGTGGVAKTDRLHRWVLAQKLGGNVPRTLFACHKCNVRCCVNPDHLYAGTPGDNARDTRRAGRVNRNARNAKLTPEQVEEIYLAPQGLERLSAKYGVNLGCVIAIRSGKTWREVTRHLGPPPIVSDRPAR